MPTLALHTPPTHLDGWHRVIAPGGYESWHFEADSSDGRTRIIAGLHLGAQSNRRYMRRYAWYRAMPTRVAPPTPGDWPSVTLDVEHEGERVAQIDNKLDSSDFDAATDSLRVRIGSSHVASRADGAVQLSMRGRSGAMTAAVDLLFTPVLHVNHRWLVTPQHQVMLVDPLCEVAGEVQVFDTARAAAPPRVIRVEGRGYREHRVGLRSAHDGGGMVMARKLDDGRVAVAREVDDCVRVIELDANGARERGGDVEEFRAAGWRVEKLWRRGWLGALGL